MKAGVYIRIHRENFMQGTFGLAPTDQAYDLLARVHHLVKIGGHFLLTAPGVRQFYRPGWTHQRGYRDDVITFGGRGIPNGQPCYVVVHAF